MTRLLLSLLLITSVTEAADGYLVDGGFCNARALVGKATAEARDRGVPSKEWRAELFYTKTKEKQGTLLHAGVTQAIYDVDNIYGVSRKINPTNTYINLYKSCIVFAGMAIR